MTTGFGPRGGAFLSVVGTEDSKQRIDQWLEAQSEGHNPALDETSLP